MHWGCVTGSGGGRRRGDRRKDGCHPQRGGVEQEKLFIRPFIELLQRLYCALLLLRRTRLREEVSVMQRLRHPQIVRYLGCGMGSAPSEQARTDTEVIESPFRYEDAHIRHAVGAAAVYPDGVRSRRLGRRVTAREISKRTTARATPYVLSPAAERRALPAREYCDPPRSQRREIVPRSATNTGRYDAPRYIGVISA